MKRAPLPRALLVAGVVTWLVFIAEVLYLYAFKFLDSIHSDASVTALLAWRMLSSGSAVLRDYYWVNGDVWLLSPHLFALIPVAVLGVGPKALLVAVVSGFLFEAAVLTWAFGELVDDVRVAIFATTATMFAWSRLHVLFVYVELSYGFIATLHVLLFVGFARWFTRGAGLGGKASRRLPALLVVVVFLATLQNPSRGVLFAIGPLLVALVWPFGKIAVAARLRVAAAVLVPGAAAVAVYQLVFRRILTFSTPRGHDAFVVKDLAGIVTNVTTLARGIASLAGAREELDVLVVPGVVLMAGALALVVRESFRRRELSLIRFVCIAALAQFFVVLGPMVIGNLVVNPPSARYLIPSILQFLGLGVVIATRNARELRARSLSLAWILLVPAVATLSAVRLLGTYSLEAKNGQWAHSSAHTDLAKELMRRGLTHGFATYWNSNLVRLLSHGTTTTCSISFADHLIPYRWLTDVACFDAAKLPERIYVVQTVADRSSTEAAVRASLATPIEQFEVDGYFDVSVFRRDDASLDWLTPPLPESEDLRFPLHLQAIHPAVRVGKGARSREGVTATQEEGAITFGPYLTLPKGHYRLRWFGTGAPSDGEIAFDVGGNNGKDLFGQTSVPASRLATTQHGQLIELEFDLTRTTSGIEFRSYSRGGGRVTLEEVVLDH